MPPGTRLIDAPKLPLKTENMLLEVKVELKTATAEETEKELKALQVELDRLEAANKELESLSIELKSEFDGGSEAYAAAMAEKTDHDAKIENWIAKQGEQLLNLSSSLTASQQEWVDFFENTKGPGAGIKASLEDWKTKRENFEVCIYVDIFFVFISVSFLRVHTYSLHY